MGRYNLSMTDAVDVIVIGAGPAGSVTASLLAQLGYSVEIWETRPFPRFRIGESLPPRAVSLIKHLGFGPAVGEANFAVMEGHTSIWSDGVPKRAVFEGEAGLQVDRGRFDQVLIEASQVPIYMRRMATGLVREGTRVAGASFIEGSKTGRVRARWVVVAAGPRSRFGRSTGPRKTHLSQWGIVGYWRQSEHPPGSQMNDTIIESFPDGWIWSLRLASDLRNVTVLFGPDSLVRVRQGVEWFYRKAVGAASFTNGLLEGATLNSKPVGVDASWLCVENFSEPGLLLVGDSGSVIDPLTSQGVYKAMCAAMTASAVIHTSLQKPQMEEVALAYFDEEERRTFDGYAAGSVKTFRDEQRWPESPFWEERHHLQTWDTLLVGKSETRSSFPSELTASIEAGRSPDLNLVRDPSVSIESRPFLKGSEILMSNCVVTEALPYGYRGPQHEELVRLCRAVQDPRRLGEVVGNSHERAMVDVLRSISYLCQEGVLRKVE